MSTRADGLPRVAVLMGGPDAEHEVSLMSGAEVARALAASGRFEVVPWTIARDGCIDDAGILALRPDAVYPVLHGPWGEGGPLQEILESIEASHGIPFVGPGSRAARIAMDKESTKRFAREAGVRTPESCPVVAGEPLAIAPPVVLKPSNDGSSVDLRICRDESELLRARAELEPKRPALMAERFVSGREMTVGIVDGETLPIIEIVPRTAFYDYEAKYLRDDTEYRLEPALPAEIAAEMHRATRAVFAALGLRDAARADFIVDGAGAWFLEINSAPGMTTHSLVPKAARHRGIGMPELCAGFVTRALARARPAITT